MLAGSDVDNNLSRTMHLVWKQDVVLYNRCTRAHEHKIAPKVSCLDVAHLKAQTRRRPVEWLQLPLIAPLPVHGQHTAHTCRHELITSLMLSCIELFLHVISALLSVISIIVGNVAITDV